MTGVLLPAVPRLEGARSDGWQPGASRKDSPSRDTVDEIGPAFDPLAAGRGPRDWW